MISDRFSLPVAVEAFSLQDTTQAGGGGSDGSVALIWAGSVLLFIVLVGLPLLATCIVRKDKMELKGLGLPAGSVRSMLALLTVGVFVVVATYGRAALGAEYERVLTTLATLAGPVLGFYFGSRGSDEKTGKDNSRRQKADGNPVEAEDGVTTPS